MRRVLVGLLLSLAVVGCQEGGSERLARPEPASVGRATTVGQRAPDPGGEAAACTAGATKAVVREFFAALSAGRVTGLDGFFAPATHFRWYANSVPPGTRLDSDALNRGSLLGYLQRRQARHERITVDSVDFNGYRAVDSTGNFSMLLRRTADDIASGAQLLGGKGAVDCESQRLMVVAIGRRP
jgi:hypothetical protein